MGMLYATIMVELFVLVCSQTLSPIPYEGPATIDYFKQSLNISAITKLPELRCWDQWREWNEGNAWNTHFGQTNVSDISYIFFDETNNSYPVKYYRINITSKIKETYKFKYYVTTTCELSEVCGSPITSQLYFHTTLSQCGIPAAYDGWLRYHDYTHYPNDSIALYNEYCNYSSLDTFMYILREKKGRINLIESKDDCLSSDNCIITSKSLIDLSNYQEGIYIIGIGGYGTEYGKYQLQVTCSQYSYPITIDEINPHQIETNLGKLKCGMQLHNQSLTDDNPVMYYSLNITQTTYFPFIISIYSYNIYAGLDAYIIGVDQLGLSYDVIIKMPQDTHISSAKVTIHENIDNILVGNTYWIMLQGFINRDQDFSIYMECHDPPTSSPTKQPTIAPSRMPTSLPTKAPTIAPKIPEQLVMGLVFSLCGLFILLFIIYYICKWKQYIDDKKSKQHSNSNIKTPSYGRSPKGQKVRQNDDDSDISDNENQPQQTVELVVTTVSKEKTVIDKQNDDGIKSAEEDENKFELPQRDMSTVSIRSLHGNKSVGSQLEENEDIVQLILSDAIQSCIDQSGFDIYQVLALRYYNESSQNVIARRPFSSIGINIELIELSPFTTTTFSAIIVGLTQTFGMSMVIYKLFMGYFGDGDMFDKLCLMDEERWSQVFSLKLLAFLLSLVVTLFVGGLINGVKHDGLYEIVAQLSLKHIERIPNIAFWILQIGQGVNFYVCFWAVIGSYFIIFVSNTGELQDDGSSDYSSAGMDMILNAIALFFMLELDDMLVSDEDYNDCQQHLENVLYHYVPDRRINTKYIFDKKDDDNNDNNKGRVDSSVQNKFGKCEGYVISFMYHLINFVSVFVTVCCYGSGFIAPFVIFFCW